MVVLFSFVVVDLSSVTVLTVVVSLAVVVVGLGVVVAVVAVVVEVVVVSSGTVVVESGLAVVVVDLSSPSVVAIEVVVLVSGVGGFPVLGFCVKPRVGCNGRRGATWDYVNIRGKT